MENTDTERGESEGDGIPKIHNFLKEMTNWLTMASIIFIVVYGILIIVYEIALDLTHVRWAFLGFLGCCSVDIASYWICRFAVQGSGGIEKCFLRLVFVLQIVTGCFYVVAPIVAICVYKFTPESSKTDVMANDKENDDQVLNSFEDYVSPNDPCFEEDGKEKKEPMWQCGYVNSIRIASWWMLSAFTPKPLIYYLIFQILKPLSNNNNNVK